MKTSRIAFVSSSLLATATCNAFSPSNRLLHERNDSTYHRLLSRRSYFSSNEVTQVESISLLAVSDHDSESVEERSDPHLVFPGGGIFFYWQAGAVTYLREQGYDLSGASLSGASAGALTATLTATGVDFAKATTLALDLAQDAGVWDRSAGLQGVWGPIIEQWLDELLPEDAVDMVEGRLSLLVTPVPSFAKSKITDFQDRKDLIRCNMASVHLPWFLDSKLTSNFRGAPHIDGSFLASARDYYPEENNTSVISLDWTRDPIMAEKAYDFVKVISKEGIWSMVETGMKFSEKMELNGDFEMLPRFEGA